MVRDLTLYPEMSADREEIGIIKLRIEKLISSNFSLKLASSVTVTD
jgi:hypothetical protein